MIQLVVCYSLMSQRGMGLPASLFRRETGCGDLLGFRPNGSVRSARKWCTPSTRRTGKSATDQFWIASSLCSSQ
jgi:hypothetical protein